MKNDFIKCGALGWCIEVFWTGLRALGNREWTMTGYSSLLMFPIYGMAACIGPVSRHLKGVPTLVRGSLYMLGIFAAEFGTGMFLKHFHMCPWDYSRTPYHYKGVIRLDYAPVWFFTGLFYEKILSSKE